MIILENNIKPFGLSTRDLDSINNIFKKYPLIETVYIFGSRANGTFKSGSDIDFVIKGQTLNQDIINHLMDDFEDSDLPYFVDILEYQKLNNPLLKEIINKEGKLFYQKQQ